MGNTVMQRMSFIDVTSRTIQRPESVDRIGKTVREGEISKQDFYERYCSFPSNVTVVSFAIDSYGHWGDIFVNFLKDQCAKATCDKVMIKEYNKLINQARVWIQLAQLRGKAKIISKLLMEGV